MKVTLENVNSDGDFTFRITLTREELTDIVKMTFKGSIYP